MQFGHATKNVSEVLFQLPLEQLQCTDMRLT